MKLVKNSDKLKNKENEISDAQAEEAVKIIIQ